MSDPHVQATPPADDEPKTPMWLPALGATLLVGLALVWAVMPKEVAPTASQPAASVSASASAAPPPPPPPPLPTLTAPPPAASRPAMPSEGAPANDRMKRVRDRIQPAAPTGHP